MLIYVLVNPTTNAVFYVGKTCLSLNERLSGHISSAKSAISTNTPTKKYIQTLLAQNQRPKIGFVEVTKDKSKEQYWIREFKKQTTILTNMDVLGHPSASTSIVEIKYNTKYHGNPRKNFRTVNSKRIDVNKLELYYMSPTPVR